MAAPKPVEEGDEAEVQPMVMRAAALSVTGDFLLLVGLLFVLLGIASFVTDFLDVKGSGEFLVGFFIIALAVVLLMRSGQVMPRVPRAPKAQRPMEKSESYR
ncbi:MAG: hypothetical protein PHV13_00630 [Candidatus ainarchaeum sp.]|nr:hypothetical protein [Candidatus ainarchaeum sp.]